MREEPLRLPVRKRGFAWCAWCDAALAPGAVRCLKHPEAEVYIQLVEGEAQDLPAGLLRHWGEPHVTDGSACFCLPDEVLGMVIHQRLPWDPPRRPHGEA